MQIPFRSGNYRLCNGRDLGRRLPQTIAGHVPRFVTRLIPARRIQGRQAHDNTGDSEITDRDQQYGMSGKEHRGVQKEPFLQVVALGRRRASYSAQTQADHIAEAMCDDRWSRRGVH